MRKSIMGAGLIMALLGAALSITMFLYLSLTAYGAEPVSREQSFTSLLLKAMENQGLQEAKAMEEGENARYPWESIRLKKVIKTVRTVAAAGAAGTASGGLLLFLFRIVFYANVYNRSRAGDYEECGSCKIRRKKGRLLIVIGGEMLEERETEEWKCTFSKAFLFLHAGKKLLVCGPDEKRLRGRDVEIAENAYFTL
ncbi:MAG: hypothetical protein K6A92_11770 [Lachnospiraceae bacterium]|nr:hypothetical protein [Lachnospiraceae bacterium]